MFSNLSIKLLKVIQFSMKDLWKMSRNEENHFKINCFISELILPNSNKRLIKLCSKFQLNLSKSLFSYNKLVCLIYNDSVKNINWCLE